MHSLLIDYENVGDVDMADPPTSGLSVARQMAMISYRNAKVGTDTYVYSLNTDSSIHSWRTSHYTNSYETSYDVPVLYTLENTLLYTFSPVPINTLSINTPSQQAYQHILTPLSTLSINTPSHPISTQLLSTHPLNRPITENSDETWLVMAKMVVFSKRRNTWYTRAPSLLSDLIRSRMWKSQVIWFMHPINRMDASI